MSTQRAVTWEYQSGSRDCICSFCGVNIRPGNTIYAVRDPKAYEVVYGYCGPDCCHGAAKEYGQWDEVEVDDDQDDDDSDSFEGMELDLGCVDEEPTDGDLVLVDCGPLGSRTRVAVHGEDCIGVKPPRGEFADEDVAIAACKAEAKKAGVSVAIWRMSDHGDYWLVGTAPCF